MDTEQEDILTKHFLAREQNIHKDRNIKEIKTKNGIVTNHREEIKKKNSKNSIRNCTQRKG